MPSLPLSKQANVNCNRIGGIKSIFLTTTSTINGITLGSNHDITNLVFATAGTGFAQVNFKMGEAELTESAEMMNTVSLNFAIPNPDATRRKELQVIKDACEMYAVVELYDGNELLFVGYDKIVENEGFLKHGTTESTSGRGKTDANLFSATLTAEQGEYVRVLSGISGATVPATTKTAIIAELLVPTSV
jgi:hypothetical protein